MELFNNEKCRSCRYADYAEDIVICGYFVITGRLRGCPGGEACTKYEEKEGEAVEQVSR